MLKKIIALENNSKLIILGMIFLGGLLIFNASKLLVIPQSTNSMVYSEASLEVKKSSVAYINNFAQLVNAKYANYVYAEKINTLAPVSLQAGILVAPAIPVTMKKEVAVKKTPYIPFISNPRVVEKVAPIYPQEAILAGIEGQVLLNVMVGETGIVSSVSVAKSSGNAALDTSALEAAKQWIFAVVYNDQIATKFNYRLPITFKLN